MARSPLPSIRPRRPLRVPPASVRIRGASVPCRVFLLAGSLALCGCLGTNLAGLTSRLLALCLYRLALVPQVWLDRRFEDEQQGRRVRDGVVVAQRRAHRPSYKTLDDLVELVREGLADPATQQLDRLELASFNERALDLGLDVAKDDEDEPVEEVALRFGRSSSKAIVVPLHDGCG